MVAKVFEHPFDLCKVRLQSQVLDTTARFNGPIDCLYKTWKYEGIRGLYRVSTLAPSRANGLDPKQPIIYCRDFPLLYWELLLRMRPCSYRITT